MPTISVGDIKMQYVDRAYFDRKNNYYKDLTSGIEKLIKSNLEDIEDNVLEYALDDFGNVDFFCDVYKNLVLYNLDNKCFYYWSGKIWVKDEYKKIEKMAEEALKNRRDFTLDQTGFSEEVRSYNESLAYYYALKLCNKLKVSSMIELLKARLSKENVKFNNHLYYLNLLNNTINLKSTDWEESNNSHKQNDLLTYMIPYDFHPDGNAPIPYFESFLKGLCSNLVTKDNELQQVVNFFIEVMASCLLGIPLKHNVYAFVKDNCQGLEVLLSFINIIMGSYAAEIPYTNLDISNKALIKNKIDIEQKRLIYCDLSNTKSVLSKTKLNDLYTPYISSTNILHNEYLNKKCFFKTIIVVDDINEALEDESHCKENILFIPPFNSNMVIENDVLYNLLDNAEAVINKLIKSTAKLVQTRAISELPPCIADYNEKSAKIRNSVEAFYEECLEESEEQSIPALELYQKYVKYCGFQGITPVNNKTFGLKISAFIDKKRTSNNIVYTRIRLIDDFDTIYKKTVIKLNNDLNKEISSNDKIYYSKKEDSPITEESVTLFYKTSLEPAENSISVNYIYNQYVAFCPSINAVALNIEEFTKALILMGCKLGKNRKGKTAIKNLKLQNQKNEINKEYIEETSEKESLNVSTDSVIQEEPSKIDENVLEFYKNNMESKFFVVPNLKLIHIEYRKFCAAKNAKELNLEEFQNSLESIGCSLYKNSDGTVCVGKEIKI